MDDKQIAVEILKAIRAYNLSYDVIKHVHRLGERPWTDHIDPILNQFKGRSNFVLAVWHLSQKHKWCNALIPLCEEISGTSYQDLE